MRMFAVFGNPIAHSKSPILHNYALCKLGIDARYLRYLLKDGEDFRALFFSLGLSGANITLPYKEDVAKICDEVRGIAQKIGAVNTIKREYDKIIGYNTDGIGFYKNIEDKNINSALIFGAGGSARAVAMMLRENHIRTIISNRSRGNLAYFDNNGFETYTSDDIVESTKNIAFDIIINATSSSINGTLPMQKEALESIFARAKIAFDLMYGRKCEFLELAKTMGLDTIDGSKMLLYQAIAALSIFINMDEALIKPHMEYIYTIINR